MQAFGQHDAALLGLGVVSHEQHASSHRHPFLPAFMLVARQLTKEYRSGQHQLVVLRDVSFTVPQGAFVAIVGPSGSGKTTLLGLLAGVLRPTGGSVRVLGHELSRMSGAERSRLMFKTAELISPMSRRLPSSRA